MRLSRAAPVCMAETGSPTPNIVFSMLSLVRLYREPPRDKLQVCIPRRFRWAAAWDRAPVDFPALGSTIARNRNTIGFIGIPPFQEDTVSTSVRGR